MEFHVKASRIGRHFQTVPLIDIQDLLPRKRTHDALNRHVPVHRGIVCEELIKARPDVASTTRGYLVKCVQLFRCQLLQPECVRIVGQLPRRAPLVLR